MIRAALLNAWPSLSHLFGLHPWDVPRLTAAELDRYLDALEDYQREMRREG